MTAFVQYRLDGEAEIASRSTAVSAKQPLKPFLWWVGGKQRFVKMLMERMPPEFCSYYEPFLGGGSLFFAAQPSRANLSDANRFLILAYLAVRDRPHELLQLLREHEKNNSRPYFLSCRSQIPNERDELVVASLFIYLNRAAYNGLIRENKRGEFKGVFSANSLFRKLFDEDHILECSAALSGANIVCQSFENVRVEPGAFYYFDPPYYAARMEYCPEDFDERSQIKLSELCRAISDAGGFFMVSNYDNDFIRKLYDGFLIETVRYADNFHYLRRSDMIIRNYEARLPNAMLIGGNP